MKWGIYILALLVSVNIYPQKIQVKNVTSFMQDNKMIITYDLAGAVENELFNISVYVSTDGGHNFSGPLKKVTGDTGFRQTGGIGREIIWNLVEEVSQLISDSAVFKVTAELVPVYARNLVFVEAGSFLMGKDEGSDDEKPAHEVKVDDFFIGKFETTVLEYKAFCKETGREMPKKEIEWIDDHPMTFVSWNDANDYCKWLSGKTHRTFRLPTEAEWEYAARGARVSNNTIFSGSDNINDVGWYRENSNGVTHSRVGNLSPNELGLMDMSGNVWEWCSDWYSQSYYSQSPGNNPKGPRAGSVKSARGGSWFHPKVTVTYRFYMTPTAASNYMGFRVVMEP